MFRFGLLANSNSSTTDQPNPTRAAYWYKKAVEKNHAGAMNNLALLYRDGKGVTKDLAEHIFLLHRTNALKQPTSFLALGDAYLNGWGVTRDVSRAITLFKKAIELDEHSGWVWIGDLYRHGNGVRRSKREAIDTNGPQFARFGSDREMRPI